MGSVHHAKKTCSVFLFCDNYMNNKSYIYYNKDYSSGTIHTMYGIFIYLYLNIQFNFWHFKTIVPIVYIQECSFELLVCIRNIIIK